MLWLRGFMTFGRQFFSFAGTETLSRPTALAACPLMRSLLLSMNDRDGR